MTDQNPATRATRRRPVFRYPLVPRYIGPNPAQDPSRADKPENFVAANPAKPHIDAIDWVGEFLLTSGALAEAPPERGRSADLDEIGRKFWEAAVVPHLFPRLAFSTVSV